MNFRLAVLTVFGVLALSGCGSNNNNKPVVDFIVEPLKAGGDVKLSTDYKDKPVVVYLWATWCGPCKQFAPTLNTLADKYRPKGIEFLAISAEKKKTIEEGELKEPHRMTVMIDSYASATEALQSTALPTIMILDREHKPIWGSRGTGSTTESDMTAALDSLL